VDKPTLSPSKFTTYLACPSKYKWTHVDPRGRYLLRAKSYYSFGSTLHKVLQRFHDSGDVGVETTYQAMAAYEESWLDAGFSSAEEMAEAYGEGKAILERYIESHEMARAGGNTIAVEKLLKLDMDDFYLVGRIDRIDEHPDGTLEIVDYKSGRMEVCEEDVSCDIAMGCYQLLVRAEYPGKSVRSTIISLRTGAQASCTATAPALDEFQFALGELGRKILCHDYFELEPVYNRLCQSCDFLAACRKHPDFSEPSEATANL